MLRMQKKIRNPAWGELVKVKFIGFTVCEMWSPTIELQSVQCNMRSHSERQGNRAKIVLQLCFWKCVNTRENNILDFQFSQPSRSLAIKEYFYQHFCSKSSLAVVKMPIVWSCWSIKWSKRKIIKIETEKQQLICIQTMYFATHISPQFVR